MLEVILFVTCLACLAAVMYLAKRTAPTLHEELHKPYSSSIIKNKNFCAVNKSSNISSTNSVASKCSNRQDELEMVVDSSQKASSDVTDNEFPEGQLPEEEQLISVIVKSDFIATQTCRLAAK